MISGTALADSRSHANPPQRARTSASAGIAGASATRASRTMPGAFADEMEQLELADSGDHRGQPVGRVGAHPQAGEPDHHQPEAGRAGEDAQVARRVGLHRSHSPNTMSS